MVTTRKGHATGQLTWRTVPKVTVMDLLLGVVTCWRNKTQFSALGWLCSLLATTRYRDNGLSTATRNVGSENARVTTAWMTGGCTLVLLATKCLSTYLLTGWARTITALSLALVNSALLQFGALGFTEILCSTWERLGLLPTPTLFDGRLHALPTVTIVTGSYTQVLSTGKWFVAGVTTHWNFFNTGNGVLYFATGTVP